MFIVIPTFVLNYFISLEIICFKISSPSKRTIAFHIRSCCYNTSSACINWVFSLNTSSVYQPGVPLHLTVYISASFTSCCWISIRDIFIFFYKIWVGRCNRIRLGWLVSIFIGIHRALCRVVVIPRNSILIPKVKLWVPF